MNWLFKDNYPLIALIVIFVFLLLDIQNYQLLVILSNLLGFSFATNGIIIDRYKNKLFQKFSIYGLNIINIINIIACFYTENKEYNDYFRILMMFVLIIILLIPFLIIWNQKN